MLRLKEHEVLGSKPTRFDLLAPDQTVKKWPISDEVKKVDSFRRVKIVLEHYLDVRPHDTIRACDKQICKNNQAVDLVELQSVRSNVKLLN